MPAERKVRDLEKRIASKKRNLEEHGQASLEQLRRETSEAGLNFDRDADWASFPWMHYKEHSDVEEALLQALGLRWVVE